MAENTKPIIRLFIYIIAMFILWQILYVNFLTPGGKFDFWLTKTVTKHSIFTLNIFSSNYDIFVNHYGKCSILHNNIKIISVNHACNGQVLYPVFAAFIIATNGQLINKFSYILLGSFLIYGINVLRVISLVYIRLYYPAYLNFNHKYTFTLIVYSFIFYLWYYWVNSFSKKQLLKSND